jgi:crotonobetainyl-CoA:carnitine CoA-transferase CaiB-like acyl-CoA transferase
MSSTPSSPGALDGLRVLDLSRVLAGPWCTQMLGDLGAEVIKIEHPARGDDTRAWGPPFDEARQQSAYFQCANRNKRSVALDFAQPEGAELLRRLAQHSDVVVENFKPGTLARYGLAPAQLLALNPRLVVCSISGFGQQGSMATQPGYDLVVQAMGGLMSITGPAEGEPGSAPHKVGVAVADLFTGLHAVTAILAALHHRARSGQGQLIDLALFDCQLSMLANVASQALVSGKRPLRQGNRHASIAPYESLPCADGELVLAVGNDAQFRRACQALGLPALAKDARFASNALRVQHRDELSRTLAECLRQAPRAHWLAALQQAEVPAAPVLAVDEALAHPQVAERGLLQPLDPADPGSRPDLASPLRLSTTPVQRRLAPPALGADGDAVLTALGLSKADLLRLREKGVLGP